MRTLVAGIVLLVAFATYDAQTDEEWKTRELAELGLRVSDVDSPTTTTSRLAPTCKSNEKEVADKLAKATAEHVQKCHWIKSLGRCRPVKVPFTWCRFSRHYRIYVPAGACNLIIKTTGGWGNADLYVRRDSPAFGPWFYHYSSTNPGNNEMIHIGCNYSARWYYIQVRAASMFNGVVLEACYCTGCCKKVITELNEDSMIKLPSTG